LSGGKGIDVVCGGDAVAIIQETTTKIAADEAGPAGDEEVHWSRDAS
jgi:hypothetical protein